MPEFKEWPKIARLNRDVVITEKIDGTNACVIVDEDGGVYAQSRSRIITPEDDNHGFARWVQAHEGDLKAVLGVGRHFGEWWGSGIQRGYGLQNGDKRLSLFNVERWKLQEGFGSVRGLGVVPVLYWGAFDTSSIRHVLGNLESTGSRVSAGFMKPEGIVIYHPQGNVSFKVTLENDGVPKGKVMP